MFAAKIAPLSAPETTVGANLGLMTSLYQGFFMAPTS